MHSCFKRNSSYRHMVSCCGDDNTSTHQTTSNGEKESLINSRFLEGQRIGVKERFLRKLSIFMDMRLPVLNNFQFTQLGGYSSDVKRESNGISEGRSKETGGSELNGNGFDKYIVSTTTDSECSFIDGRKTKNSANSRLKIIVSRKKLGSAQQKTSTSKFFSWKLNHRRSSPFRLGYSTLVLTIFLIFCSLFNASLVSVKGQIINSRTDQRHQSILREQDVRPKIIRRESVLGRRIFEFESYRDGQIFHFNVPLDTKIATWKFLVNATDGCRPGKVSVYLRPGGYPVVNADGGSFPENMKIFGDMVTHNLTFDPLEGRANLVINSPLPDDWFMLAHTNRRQEDEEMGFVQRSIKSSCSTWLHVEVEYQLENDIMYLFPEKHNHQKMLLFNYIAGQQTYRFFTGENVWSAYVNITKCRIKSEAISPGQFGGGLRGRGSRGGQGQRDEIDACPLRISVAPRRPPNYIDPKTRRHNCMENDYSYALTQRCSLDLYPEENAWHYITVQPTVINKIIEFSISVVITDCPHPMVKNNYLLLNKIDPYQICSGATKSRGAGIQLLFPPYKPDYDVNHWANRKCGKRIMLVRRTLPHIGPFAFEYRLPSSFPQGSSSSNLPPPYIRRNASSHNQDPAYNIELENELPSVLQFPIEIEDIGGSLVVELGIQNSKLSGVVNELYTIKACLSRGKKIIPRLDPGRDPLTQSESNSGQSSSNLGMNQGLNDNAYLAGKNPREREEALLCPGGRLLSLNVSGSERNSEFARVLVPYPAAGNWFVTIFPSCSKILTNRRPYDQPDMTYYDTQQCQKNMTPIIFSIYSDMCVMGDCGKYGRCYQFFSGGNMFSTCTCYAGYRGWGCTDDREATSEIDLLAATLLLCLSNLLFLPAVGLAIYRGFYTESFVYFANMVFSTLYHACDQDVFSICLMKYSVLQFCDIYTATMAYWVTVLAMGALPEQARSLLQMVGAVGVALAIEYDRSGVFTFLVPGAIGILLLVGAWVTRCTTDRTCFPGFKYICCFFLPGLAIISGGLFCFVFLEQESNFQFVHSIWHVAMAVSIIFLLPQTPTEKEEKYTFLDTRMGYTPPQVVESSFKHYSDMTGGDNGPELINMTSSGGIATSSSLMQPDPFVDVTLQRNMGGSVATLNNGGGVATLPRSSLAKRGENHVHSHQHSHHGTLLKRSVDELRMHTSSPSGAVIVTSASVGGGASATPDHLHHHEPS